ncbi:MAG: sulfotransferase, partial [bacterium]
LQGYTIGNQRQAELLFDDWVRRDFKKIIRYCRTAQFFQDSPFSYPYTFIAMDQAFPGSKFILTVRDSAEEWYNSLIRFHGKLWGNGNIPPTAEDLKNATYIYKGRPYHTRFHVHDVPEDEPYKKDVLVDYYNTHNKNVKDYFRHRANDLLVINLKEPDGYTKFCNFLGCKNIRKGFPWENKTE